MASMRRAMTGRHQDQTAAMLEMVSRETVYIIDGGSTERQRFAQRELRLLADGIDRLPTSVLRVQKLSVHLNRLTANHADNLRRILTSSSLQEFSYSDYCRIGGGLHSILWGAVASNTTLTAISFESPNHSCWEEEGAGIMQALGSHPTLRSIRIEDTIGGSLLPSFLPLLRGRAPLQSLCLEDFQFNNDEESDANLADCFEAITTHPSLVHLAFSGLDKLNAMALARCLPRMVRLKSLQLQRFVPEIALAVCNGIPASLKKLDLSRVYVENDMLETLVEVLLLKSSLEHLVLQHLPITAVACNSFTRLVRMHKHLKTLCATSISRVPVENQFRISAELVDAVSDESCQLERLDIRRYPTDEPQQWRRLERYLHTNLVLNRYNDPSLLLQESVWPHVCATVNAAHQRPGSLFTLLKRTMAKQPAIVGGYCFAKVVVDPLAAAAVDKGASLAPPRKKPRRV